MVTFVGDLFLGNQSFKIEDELIKSYNSNNYFVVNFENVYHNSILKKRIDKSSNLTFKESSFKYLNSYISSKLILNLGNNHINDLGQEGVKGTINILDKYKNVYHLGVGKLPDLLQPLIIKCNNKKIALLSVSTNEPEVMSIIASKDQIGVLDYKNPLILDTIIWFKKQVDYFIVIPHWGKEFMPYPSVQQRNLAYEWIDAGADLIVGHHPHVIQGKEIYKEKSIYYSLGNYIFPNFYYKEGVLHKWEYQNNQSISLQVTFADKMSITESGLFFDTHKNILSMSSSSLEKFKTRSKALDLKLVSVKKYFSIWQLSLYLLLKKEYSLFNKVKKMFIKHKKYSRVEYLLRRLIKIIIK
jgi:hypothetical protein